MTPLLSIRDTSLLQAVPNFHALGIIAVIMGNRRLNNLVVSPVGRTDILVGIRHILVYIRPIRSSAQHFVNDSSCLCAADDFARMELAIIHAGHPAIACRSRYCLIVPIRILDIAERIFNSTCYLCKAGNNRAELCAGNCTFRVKLAVACATYNAQTTKRIDCLRIPCILSNIRKVYSNL